MSVYVHVHTYCIHMYMLTTSFNKITRLTHM